MSDVTFDMSNNGTKVHDQRAEPWNVTLVDTGDESMTGVVCCAFPSISRMMKPSVSYGDGVDIDITARLFSFINSMARVQL